MTSITTETLLTKPKTYGRLRYVAPGHTVIPSQQPYVLPDISQFGDERVMPLHDIRPIPAVDQLSSALECGTQLSTHGFTAVKYPSVLHSAPYTPQSWQDADLLEKVYIPEIEKMLKQVLSAKTVVTETILIRCSSQAAQSAPSASNGTFQRSAEKEAQEKEVAKSSGQPTSSPHVKPGFPLKVGFSTVTGAIPPAPKVHVDYIPSGARIHIRNAHPTVVNAFAPVVAAEERLLAAGLPLDTHYSSSPDAPRWAIYSIWRPLKPVKRDPLAMCDMRTFAEEDCIPIDVPALTMDEEGGVKGKHTFRACVGKAREGHRWCYVSEQQPEEVLIVGLWDSDREGKLVGSGGAMHSSVELLGREAETPRESLELRCLVVW